MMFEDWHAIHEMENPETESDRAWEAWLDSVCATAGIENPDGDQIKDGYCLDLLHEMYIAGLIPKQATRIIKWLKEVHSRRV